MKKTIISFLLISVLLIFLTEATKYLLDFDKLIYNSLSENLTTAQITKFLSLQEKWKNTGFLFVFVYVFIKTTVISSFIFTAVFFFNRDKISFNSILNIVLKAEFIFLLVPLLKIFWFCFFQTNYTLEDFQNFFPFSTLNIIGYKGLVPWLIYPLQILNLFELAYIIYLSYEIGKLTKTNADNGFKIMMYSYVPTMLLWVCVVMFLTLSMS